MKRTEIVLCQIVMVLMAIGAHVVMLVMGGDWLSTALAPAATTLVGAGLAVEFGAAFALSVFVSGVSIAAALLASADTIDAAGLPVALTVLGIFAALGASKLHVGVFEVSGRWALITYGIGAGTIFGALVIGSVGWAIAIGAIGTLALLAVWKLGPKAVSAATAPAPAPNGG